MCTHLFNGDPENDELVLRSQDIVSQFKNAKLITIPYDLVNYYSPTYYHNLSRFIGMKLSKNDWVFFLDADEIVDDEFNDWFQVHKNDNISYTFSCYWYFRQPEYRAKQKESAGVLMRKGHCQSWDLDNNLERKQFFNDLYHSGKLIHGDLDPIFSLNGNIMVHHFSWVKDKQDMLNKVKNWGHKNDKPWTQLVEEEFSRPFNGTDFVHNYQYDIVDNKFNIQV
jgi:hypothetical protein